MPRYTGIATDVYTQPDPKTGLAALSVAQDINISGTGALVPRQQVVLAAPGTMAPVPEFYNFGRRLWVQDGFVYASRLMAEDVPDELLYVYVGESPRLLWCTKQGTYVSVQGALLFLAGGDWPPQLVTVLTDEVLSQNVALESGVPRGYVLCRSGVYLLDEAGTAQRVDNEQYEIPADVLAVTGVVVRDTALAVSRVVFSEIPYF